MLGVALWQGLLDGIGWLIARIYDLIPNYGVAIIILTLLIRLILLPLGIKQIKSMQHMQALQPRIKDLQKKYKGNKQKIQEETMRLYKEAGVNPLGGCLPLLLQFPILIAMYSVIRTAPVVPSAEVPGSFQIVNNHLPEDSELFRKVVMHENGNFVFLDLQCYLLGAGTSIPQKYVDPADRQQKTLPDGAPILGEDGQPLSFGATTKSAIDCGDSRFPDVIPYAILLLLMIGSTYYQQIQMQKASPPGSQSAQQQAIMRVMPLMFAFFGLSFPAGLVLYWTVSNGFQIAQQALLLKAGHIGPEALERRIAEQRERAAQKPAKPGLMSRMMERAEQAQEQRKSGAGGAGKTKGGSGVKGSDPKGTPSKASGGSRAKPSKAKPGKQLKKPKPWTGSD